MVIPDKMAFIIGHVYMQSKTSQRHMRQVCLLFIFHILYYILSYSTLVIERCK